MARLSVDFLDTHDAVPEMELDLVSGEPFGIPQSFGEGYAVFLLYRGHW